MTRLDKFLFSNELFCIFGNYKNGSAGNSMNDIVKR